MADDRTRRDLTRDRFLRRTAPGWVVLGLIFIIVGTREHVDIEALSVLVSFDIVLFGAGSVGWLRSVLRSSLDEEPQPPDKENLK